MTRWLSTLLLVACFSAIVRADVTLVQTTVMEGSMTAMAQGGGPRTSTTYVKGLKWRTEAESGKAGIADAVARQVFMLNADAKTATFLAAAAPAASTTAGASVEASIAATGRSQVIDGAKCDEFKLTSAMDLKEAVGAQMPPEAAAMMQGLKVTVAGSVWAAKDAPGAADFLAFQKAALSADLFALMAGASGANVPGLERISKALGSVQGLPYLVEFAINIEGTGPLADMMKQIGGMKVTIKTTSIKTDPLSDDLFTIPEGYTVVK